MTALTPTTSLRHPGAAALALLWRAATICLLTPVVVLLGVATLAGLALLGAARLLRGAATVLSRPGGAGAPDVPLYARAAARAADRRAARQPA
jgi:hypothetical protein